MEKPFDVKDLVQKLEGMGLPLAEEAAKDLIEAVFAWSEESIKLSESKIDDLMLALLPPMKSFLISKLDKIDGK